MFLSLFLLTFFFLSTEQLHQFLVLVCQLDHMFIYITALFGLSALFCCEMNNSIFLFLMFTLGLLVCFTCFSYSNFHCFLDSVINQLILKFICPVYILILVLSCFDTNNNIGAGAVWNLVIIMNLNAKMKILEQENTV